jgi:hypothetical protein
MTNQSASKAFKSIDQDITTAGDFIASRRQITKYKTIERAILTGNYKKNEKWNTTRVGITLIPCTGKPDCDISISGNTFAQKAAINSAAKDSNWNRNVLISTRSYDDLLDIHKGKKYANPVLNGTTNSDTNLYIGIFANVTFGDLPAGGTCDSDTKNNQAFNSFALIYPFNTSVDIGEIGTVNVSKKTANHILFPNNSQINPGIWGVDNNPGYILDPYAKFYINKCDTDALGKGALANRIRDSVQIDFRWLIEYWDVVKGNMLNGFAYPTKINFNQQYTSFTTDDAVLRLAPLPNSISSKLIVSGEKADGKSEGLLCISQEQYMFWKTVVCIY